MARAKPTPAQIRDRKAKRLAVGLSVVLLGIVVFEGPTFLKLIKGSSSTTSAAASTATTAATTTTAGETSAAAGVTTVAAAAPLVAAGPSGQLSGLTLFGAKDPFHAQVGVVAPGATAAAATTTTPAKGAKTPASATGSTSSKPVGLPTDAGSAATTTTTTAAPAEAIPIGGSTTTTSSVPFTVTTTATTPAAPPNAALISIDGKKQVVFVGESFPAKQPLFKLVKLGRRRGTVRIAVVGGSFTSGIPALLLETKKRLTLANESDGTRYAIELVKLTSAVPPPSTGSGAAAGTTTPVLPVTSTG